VDERGRAQEVEAVQGQGDFVAAAVAAVASARFQPARQNGQAIRYPVTIEFSFAVPGATRDTIASR